MDGFKLMEIIGLKMDIPAIMMSSSDHKNTIMKGVKHRTCDYLVKPVMLKELKNIWQHVIRKNWFNSNDLNVAKSEANQIEKSKKGQKRYSTEREDESEDNSEEHYTSKKTRKFKSVVKKTDGDQSNMSSVSNRVNGYTSSTPLISFGGQDQNGLNFVNAFSGYPTPRMIPFSHHAKNPTTITNSFVNPNPLSVYISVSRNYKLVTSKRSRFMDDYADSSSNVLGYNVNNGANQSNSQLLYCIENPNIFGALPDFIGSQGPLFNNSISTNFSGGVLNDSFIGRQHNLFSGVQNSDTGHLMESADRDSSSLRSTSSSTDDQDELNAVWNQGTQCKNKSHESGMNFRR
ncbi:hypothetical protein GIB67_027299 [Kingdonia uniflora]|uniref:Response regulatory domain-containing protein n=1 Tax=Kingdonia uniflora TaxID=39325 RepID=A0A7J7KYG7_9MAGN|nr:hypothetical protein GIB67_027299 [Kingdonia uniflora]